ncbi:MAG TPA: S-layer homology domain-containing protein [Firmicutes bacterium]|nr:S-layer homology domain-containing protein [Bacillota bacterium]
MKKTIIAVLSAATLALSSVPAYASVFSDIDTVPWPGAAQYIDEAYELGIITGYIENDQRLCKPKNNVTYCEAVQLMYALMNSYSGTSVNQSAVSKWQSTMAAENIPSWAYNAVAYALENSILSRNDISIFMASSTVQNNARREDIAVIFGKALSKVYSLASNPTLTYNDKAQIASTSVPYVELLNRLNIMVGDANNNFNPKVNMNRAELSVLVTKTYHTLKDGNGSGTTTPSTPSGTVVQYAGKVTQKTSSGSGYSVSVSVNGKEETFTANATTTVTGTDGKSASLSDVSTGDSVVAVCSGGVATTIIIMAEGDGSEDSTSKESGTINSIDEDKIVVRSGSKNKSYDIQDEDIDVSIDGSNSSLSTLIRRFEGGRNYSVDVYLNDDEEVVRIEAKEGSGEYDDNAISSVSKSRVKTHGGDEYNFPDDIDDEDVDDIIKLDGDYVTYEDFKEAYDDLDDDKQMIITDFDLEDEDDDESELKYLEVDTEDLETSNKSSSSADTKGLIKSISKSKVVLDNEDDDEYDFADEDDIDSLEFDGKDYDVDDDEFEEFIDDIDSALDDDEVYIELTLDSHDKITEAVAYTCTTAEGNIDRIDTSDRSIEIDNEDYDYTSSTTFSIIDGEDKITKDDDIDDAIDDDKSFEVTAIINDDNEVISVIGYVSAIDDVDVDSFHYDDEDADKCYLKLNISTSSTKYYFVDDYDGSDGLDKLDKKVNDDDENVSVDLELNEDGKIEDMTIN